MPLEAKISVAEIVYVDDSDRFQLVSKMLIVDSV